MSIPKWIISFLPENLFKFGREKSIKSHKEFYSPERPTIIMCWFSGTAASGQMLYVPHSLINSIAILKTEITLAYCLTFWNAKLVLFCLGQRVVVDDTERCLKMLPRHLQNLHCCFYHGTVYFLFNLKSIKSMMSKKQLAKSTLLT